MNRILFVILIVMCIFAFTCPAIAQTEPPSVPGARQTETPLGLKILDVALVRPLCVAGSIVSTATFLAISPLVFIMGVGEPTARVMFEAPWRFTGFRYIGQFDHYTDERPIMGVWVLTPSNAGGFGME
jgi:hypothetical protein